MKKLLFICVASTMFITGCAKGENQWAKIPLVAPLTEQEVIDYYAKEISYDTVEMRRRQYKKTEIVYNKVSEHVTKTLKDEYLKIIEEHQKNDSNLIDKNLHSYLKTLTDDMILIQEGDLSVKEYMGYYIVDAKYNTKGNNLGSFKSEANYLGVDGLIIKDADEKDKIDYDYLQRTIDEVDKYRLNIGKGRLKKLNTTKNEDNTNDLNGEDSNISTGITDGTDNELENKIETTTIEDNTSKNNETADRIRKLDWDITEINQIVGSAKEQLAYIPDINMVYNVVNGTGTLSGYGIYQEGISGLTKFGYNRQLCKGVIEISFVFKVNMNKEYEYKGFTVNNYESLDQFEDKSVTIASYVEKELNNVIEYWDRSIANRDITSLINGSILQDAGAGLKYATLGKYTNTAYIASKINRVIQRDGNYYLLEVERTVEEGALDTDINNRYRDKYYVVIVQDGVYFKINDIAFKSRELISVFEPSADRLSTRRLISLNLYGEITNTNKEEIENLLTRLYMASTNRALTNKEIQNEDGTAKIEFGMYNQFSLKAERLEYINSQMRARLLRYGVEVECKLDGKVTQWIGGYEDQAEFIAEEIYKYDLDSGIHVINYYLVSKYETDWVIEDVITIEENILENEDLYNKMDELDIKYERRNDIETENSDIETEN